MAKHSRTLGTIILAIGIINAGLILINGSFLMFLLSLASALIGAFLYFAAAELNDRVEALEEKSGIQAAGINVKDTDMQSYIYNTMTDQRLLDNGGWKCEGCGRINASYVGTCACGANKK